MRLVIENTPESKAKAERVYQELKKENEEREAAIQRDINQLRREEKAQQEGTVLEQFGDYRKLYFYLKSKVIYDITFDFCDRFVTEYHDRTKDQMIQAARSGKQNFVEGLQDGQAGLKQAIYLVSIGQGSMQELLEDYEDYLRTRRLPLWTSQHPRYADLVEFCKHRNDIKDYSPFFPRMNDEELANMAITLIHQTDRLINGYLRKLEASAAARGIRM